MMQKKYMFFFVFKIFLQNKFAKRKNEIYLDAAMLNFVEFFVAGKNPQQN